MLQLNGGDDVTMGVNGEFTFASPIYDGTTYEVTVLTQPTTTNNQTCAVTSGSGTVAGADVAVSVTCSPWTKEFDAETLTAIADSVIDTSGNVYVTGRTDDGTGNNDFFLIKHDAFGNKVYTVAGGAAVETTTDSVAVDGSGNVYVAGSTKDNLHGNTLTGAVDFFFTKYDPDGTRIYTQQLGGSFVSYGTGIAVDYSGNIYITGRFAGTLEGMTPSDPGVGAQDCFLAKYNAAGTKVFVTQFAQGIWNWCSRVATDASGNVYVFGHSQGNSAAATLTGTQDIHVAKFDSSGNQIFVKRWGVAGASSQAYDITVDPNGDLYVTGTTGGALGGTLQGLGDAFLFKLDATGNVIHSLQVGPAGSYAYGYGVTTDAAGNVYMTGATEGALDGNTLVGTGDYFVAAYDTNGNPLFIHQDGGAGDYAEAMGIAVDADGNIYLAGTTWIGLDGHPYLGAMTDAFLVKYDSTGAKQ